MSKIGKNKKGVSPVIATVLLIGMVVVLGLIVFLWFRGLTQETKTKFGDENIELACDKVQIEADYSGGTLYISNSVQVPVYDFSVKQIKEGSYETDDLSDLAREGEWDDDVGLNGGGVFEGIVDFGDADEIILIPILLGKSGSERVTHTCEERHGYSILI